MAKNIINPTVSVIMPVYNDEKYLSEAIESILQQTYTDFEFIIINDGSTDKTKKIVDSFSDSRIRYIQHQRNLGVSRSLNEGINLSKGKFIARMDGDDISLSTRIENQVKYFENHPKCGLLGTRSLMIKNNSQIPEQIPTVFTHSILSIALAFKCPFVHGSVMLRKNVLEKFNLCYREEYEGVEDYDLWSRLSSLTQMDNLSSVQYIWRQSDNSNYVRHLSFNRKHLSQIQLISESKIVNENTASIDLWKTELKMHNKHVLFTDCYYLLVKVMLLLLMNQKWKEAIKSCSIITRLTCSV